jgi:hypothetical protein
VNVKNKFATNSKINKQFVILTSLILFPDGTYICKYGKDDVHCCDVGAPHSSVRDPHPKQLMKSITQFKCSIALNDGVKTSSFR